MYNLKVLTVFCRDQKLTARELALMSASVVRVKPDFHNALISEAVRDMALPYPQRKRANAALENQNVDSVTLMKLKRGRGSLFDSSTLMAFVRPYESQSAIFVRVRGGTK